MTAGSTNVDRRRGPPTARRPKPLGRTIGHVGLALMVAFAGLALGAGYWQVIRSPDLSPAPDNPAVIAAARNVVRGAIVDRDGQGPRLEPAQRRTGEPYRVYADRGVQHRDRLRLEPTSGGPASSGRWNAELTGTSTGDADRRRPPQVPDRPVRPPEADPRHLVGLQRAAVAALGDDRGAVVMLDPTTGEVLALASTPTYDATAIANPATSRDASRRSATDQTARPLAARARPRAGTCPGRCSRS